MLRHNAIALDRSQKELLSPHDSVLEVLESLLSPDVAELEELWGGDEKEVYPTVFSTQGIPTALAGERGVEWPITAKASYRLCFSDIMPL